MCNRFRPVDPRTAAALFDLTFLTNLSVNPNTAPTEFAPILRTSNNGLKLEMARFGYLPPWAIDKKLSMTNTRTDTLRDKPAFKRVYEKNRCVIPCHGFYEFKKNEDRQPYMFERKDKQPILIAGIWAYSEPDGNPTYSFSMLTTDPNELVAPYHDRTIMMIEDYQQWLNLDRDPLDTIATLSIDKLHVRPMLRSMNSVYEKDITKIDPEFAA